MDCRGTTRKEQYFLVWKWEGILLISLLASVTLIKHELSGDDLFFHLWRIEAIKDGLKNHIFPVKIYGNFMCNQGYASGVYYPDLFLYIPALLRLAGLSLCISVKIFLFAVSLGTALVCYYVCNIYLEGIIWHY